MSIPDLPRFGMGTAAIGNLYRAIDDRTAHATVAAALETGVRYFDTAPHYGHGLAERRLGNALAEFDLLATATVSTKVGRLLKPTTARGERHGFVDADPFEPAFDYSADGIRRSLDDSRSRLRRDRIDLLLAHDLGVQTHGDEHPRHLRDFIDGGYAAMRDLRDAGEVSAIGIGVNEVAVCELLLDRVDLDVILLAGRYTLLDRTAAELLDRCQDRGVRVIVGGPYNSGILAREPGEVDSTRTRYNYAPAPVAMIDRTHALANECARHGVALPAAALQFPLRHPAVACVVSGMVGETEIQDMVARAAVPISKELWMALGADDPRAEAREQLILLHPLDNVLICVAPIAAGDELTVSGGTIPAREGITVGHKVARTALAAGDKIIKYGAPIGSMTADAACGEWVHMHNMKSDYIASHTRTTMNESQS